jgi:hypothetical protein
VLKRTGDVHGEDYRVRKQMGKLRGQRLSKRLREARGEVRVGKRMIRGETERGQRLSLRSMGGQKGRMRAAEGE